MNRVDLPAFEQLMQELADCYDRKPYSGAALKHWADALSEYPWEKVRYRLKVWRDSRAKPPMVNELLGQLREAFSDELERKAKEDKAAFSREPTPVTPHGEACMAKVRALLAGGPRKPGAWWAYELRDQERAGRVLNYAQKEMAMKACGDDWYTDNPYRDRAHPRQPDRTPGEDDE
jgi:hypothetical protein